MISKDNAYARIQKSGNLPTLPAILLKLLAACDKEDTPLSEIAGIISKDPALSFKVLQLVNSAYYGFRYSFKGIEQAVVYLGAGTIKNVTLTMSVHQVFDYKHLKRIRHFNIYVFWYHSLMCATLAKRIAQKTDFREPDEAYLSGLLLDIGKLVLISTFPGEHEKMFAELADQANTPSAELQQLGVTHCEIGAWLMREWKLSSIIADAVRYHHEPLEKIQEAFPLVKIVYAANLLNEKRNDSGKMDGLYDLLPDLNQADVQEIVEGAAEEVEQIAEDLEIIIQKPSEVGNREKKSATKGKENRQETAEDMTTEKHTDTDGTKDQEKVLQEALRTRIKTVSLLSNFLENLVRAGDIEGIIATCEQTMSILFNIEKVLFFLTDNSNVLLKGQTSSTNSLQQTSQGLTLAVHKSTSLIVKTFHDMSMSYLRAGRSTDNLADAQILTVLKCETVLLVPLITNNTPNKPAGVILLGLPPSVRILPANDSKLVQVVAQQVGLCLQMEKMKEQKKADLEAERKAVVSMTARKVAHEINNPLGIISNYLASMKLRLSEDEEITSELTIIDEEIQRISSMIGQLDMFSQKPVFHFELTDVNTIIEDIIQLVKSAHFTRPELTITFVPADTLPRIFTSRDAIKQILINLLKNAAEAMVGGGSVTVKTRQVIRETAADVQGIEIVVTDTGPGLPELITANLYTPFTTTKQSGHSGLGLSIVHKTVTDLGGTLSCTSSPTTGTSFSIFLPGSTSDGLGQSRML